MTITRIFPLIILGGALLSSTQAQPTITGANAFWYLGSGILSNGGTCSGHTGPCYYAQAAWTANANGATGTPTWHQAPAAGSSVNVSFSCSPCDNTVATAMAPSNSCAFDFGIYVTYPDGSVSDTFNVTINVPTTTTLQSGSPTDAVYSVTGFVSTTSWNVTDHCGYSDGGFDVNESFGTFIDDYIGNNWGHPVVGNSYYPGSVISDYVGAVGWTIPSTQVPQSPLGSTAVFHSTWFLDVFSLTSGKGINVRTDTQQFYRDHGRHN
jgi:hypothetical protein